MATGRVGSLRLALVVLLAIATPTRADTVTLKSGKVIEDVET